MAGNPKKPSIKAEVLRFLTKRTGEVCYLKDISTETGFAPEQVQASIWWIAKNNPGTVETKVRGRAWVYTPKNDEAEPEPSGPIGTVFECIGVSKSGAGIVRGEDGTLYVLHELDI